MYTPLQNKSDDRIGIQRRDLGLSARTALEQIIDIVTAQSVGRLVLFAFCAVDSLRVFVVFRRILCPLTVLTAAHPVLLFFGFDTKHFFSALRDACILPRQGPYCQGRFYGIVAIDASFSGCAVAVRSPVFPPQNALPPRRFFPPGATRLGISVSHTADFCLSLLPILDKTLDFTPSML